MKIAILVEGETEKAFKPILQNFLISRLQQRMPKLKFLPHNGRIPKGEKLKRVVESLLNQDDYDAVIALTDVYTGTNDFQDAADAKAKMKDWVGNHPNFYPHVAQHDFEAWLLPYWSRIKDLAKSNKSAPGGLPEQVNHGNPPSYRIKEIFETGKCQCSYNKIRDAARILKNQDLIVSVNQCPELKAFINTILSLCEVELIP
ncbi:DUF4276 family protein [Anabaena cylindrica FACHB-243]|uniref:DUF4276 family protein n=1 Tax=Anabaena cylindrica (strain ATCC 27899 / PCC 7122) TaxID=272123 RepID=K9ZIX5_ANACC|nr:MULTISPECIES: DUF4276 family protein [Anabaena]AFZ58517.1 hypothetical protein Anacy_3103 [Anabaena cylindrica PCC 7122]MBD2416279.1 DUF4276 family protein [Anabaena cylindrica FACHB-243]MBY5283268.1 DUF4276 family protein [Anabaena sp. CCAP 1446/1C]MBY5307949.1 DUF4276 family protein [Anabaena sp. CCAP 1446/1C]MCM2407342.1 DUF4276 family protein [Anabaena sp. CCAP 1446/1C]